MKRGLSLDFYGTLLHLKRPVGAIWSAIAADHGVHMDAATIEARFGTAFRRVRASGLRQHDDGRPFWRAVVADVLGDVPPPLFEALYEHFATLDDWTLAPDAIEVLTVLRAEEWGVAVLSNGDERVHRLVYAVGLTPVVDAVVLAGDVKADKPDPRVFQAVCARLGVAPQALVHVGDDPIADGRGARDAGARAIVWGIDVASFPDLRSALQ